MGNLEHPIKKILVFIEQLKKNIPLGRHFEFGDNPTILKKIEVQFEKISQSLDALNTFYASRPMQESNLYYQSIRIAHETRNFIEAVGKREAKRENTNDLNNHIHELEESIITLLKASNAYKVVHPSHSELIPDFIESPQVEIDEIAESPYLANNEMVHHSLNVHIRDNLLQSPTSQPATPAFVSKAHFLVKIGHTVFVELPRIVGRAILDVVGRDKALESTAILLGYVLIILSILVLWGIIDINSLRDWFIGWWRFFFPVK